jgi:hypothetical protein
MGFAVQTLDPTLAKQGFLNPFWHGPFAGEVPVLIKDLGSRGAGQADGPLHQNARLKKIGPKSTASLRNIAVRILQQSERAVEAFRLRNIWHCSSFHCTNP